MFFLVVALFFAGACGSDLQSALWTLAGPPGDVCEYKNKLRPCSIPAQSEAPFHGCTFEQCCLAPNAPPLQWFGDECHCPYNCLNCHGGAPLKGQQGYHFCDCPAGKKGIDCRECEEGGCAAPRNCSTEVYFEYEKVYTCTPSGYSQFFNGLFVIEANFPINGGSGNVSVQLYAFNTTSPSLMNCSMTQCGKSWGDGGMVMSCAEVECCTQGWGIMGLQQMLNVAQGASIITISNQGAGTLNQACLPFAVQFQCKAYSCDVPGSSVPPLPAGEKAVLIAVACGAALIIILVLVALFVRARKMRQAYLNFGAQKLQVNISWHDLGCRVQNVQTLRGVSGVAKPGRLLAILGESGAGKTTLLDMLAGRKTVGELSGTVLVNENDKRPPDWSRVSSYVMQDDVFMEELTVREAVLFSAYLRLPSLMNDEERLQRTDAAIAQMGLTHCANTIIGGPSRKGISGGERKRLQIAVELVTNPSVILIDEITSGLDSANGQRVLECVSQLTRSEGKTVIITIHQPSFTLYEMFDDVLVLAKGRTFYFGPARKLPMFMKSVDHAMPEHGCNPAEFVIHTAAAVTTNPVELEAICAANANFGLDEEDVAVNALKVPHVGLHTDGGPLDETRPLLGNSRSDSGGSINYSIDGDREPSPILEVKASDISKSLGAHAQPAIVQFYYLTVRNVKAMLRGWSWILMYGMALGCGLLLGALYYQVGPDQTGVQDRTGVLFFVIVLQSILSLSSIDALFSKRAGYLRETQSGYYSPAAFFCSVALTEIILLRVIPSIILSLACYWLIGLHPGLGHFFWFAFLVVCVSLASVTLSLLISSVVGSVAVGNVFAVLILTLSILFGGLLVNINHSFPALQWLRYLSFVSYAFEALMINELSDLTLIISVPGSSPTPVSGAYYLTLLGLNINNFYMDLYLLIAYGVVMLVVGFLLLRFLVKERR